MAANFWISSHCKQLVEKCDAGALHPRDAEAGFTLVEVRKVKIHHADYITKLAMQCKLRQRVVATAIIYYRRLYTKHAFVEYDPRLSAPACLYLASKAEESPVQAKLLVHMMKKLKVHKAHHFDVRHLLEMEMYLLESLSYNLIVFHPYRPLAQFLTDAGVKEQLLRTAWAHVNDSYKTDLLLVHPPYMVALACMYLASVSRDIDIRAWFEELRVDLNEVQVICMDMLEFYEAQSVVLETELDLMLSRLGDRT
eukprot:jgi/Chlat1/3899/Chrsp26S04018